MVGFLPRSPRTEKLLTEGFFARPTAEVAHDLIGKILVRVDENGSVTAVRLVETEAYLGRDDLASHARHGPTLRNGVMFGPPGHLYVYLIYGLHHCVNIVAKSDGIAGAVLLRAATSVETPDDPRRFSGPGKLTRALNITRSDHGLSVSDPCARIYLADDGFTFPRIKASARVGVDYAGVWAKRRLRFYAANHPAVSGGRMFR